MRIEGTEGTGGGVASVMDMEMVVGESASLGMNWNSARLRPELRVVMHITYVLDSDTSTSDIDTQHTKIRTRWDRFVI